MTAVNNFNDAMVTAGTTALNNYILPTICSWLQTNKNITVTPAELASALQVQIQKNIIVGTNNPLIPPVPAGGGGRKKAQATTPEVVPEGEGCIRIPTNGRLDKRGIQCNKPRLPGKMYCKSCNKLKSGGNEGATTAKPTPGLTTAPTQPVPEVKEIIKEVTINASRSNKYPDYYEEQTCKLLFKAAGVDKFIPYARASDDGSKVLRLTEIDRIYAKQLGMTFATKAEEEKEFDYLTSLCTPIINQIVNPQFAVVTPPIVATPNTDVYNPNAITFQPITF